MDGDGDGGNTNDVGTGIGIGIDSGIALQSFCVDRINRNANKRIGTDLNEITDGAAEADADVDAVVEFCSFDAIFLVRSVIWDDNIIGDVGTWLILVCKCLNNRGRVKLNLIDS